MKFAEPPDRQVARIAARQHGRISIVQLRAAGLGQDAVARRVAHGWLHRVHHGVYAVGHRGDTMHARFMAAVLAGDDGAVLSHWAALALWELVRPGRGAVDVSVRSAGARKRAGIRFHRMVALDPRDVTSRHAIRVTTAARALVDIAPQLPDVRLRRLVRKAQAEGIASAPEIAALLARTRGIPTRSADEDCVLALLLSSGIQRPAINQPLAVGANIYYPDMRWPAERLILEIDSRWHEGRLAREDDAIRQANLEASGERVLRTTMKDATANPHGLVARLIAAGAPRAWQPGSANESRPAREIRRTRHGH